MFGNLFLSVGAMKAGTTWLYSVLNRHPELHFTPEKEIHYFYHRYVNPDMLAENNRLANARERYLFRFDPQKANIDRIRSNLHWVSHYLSRPVDDHWYRNLFQLHAGERWACDFSNLSALLPTEAWQQIESQCRNLKVLYTMRDPTERLWSHTKFHLQITGNLNKTRHWRPRNFYNFAKQSFIFENSEYGKILKNLEHGLTTENLMVLNYEDIHSDQRKHLKEIEDFLGVSNINYSQVILDKRPTESARLPMPDFFPRLFAKEVDQIKQQLREMGYKIPQSWL